jgi:hypothetical protein
VLSDSEDLPIPSESSPRPAPSKRSSFSLSLSLSPAPPLSMCLSSLLSPLLSPLLSSPHSEKKNFLSKNLFTQSSDSDSYRDSNDSTSNDLTNAVPDYSYHTPVRSKPHSSSSSGLAPGHPHGAGAGAGDGEDGDDENDRGGITTAAAVTASEASAEAMRTHQLLQMERKQLEIERKQFEFEKKMFETEKNQFENEKKLFQKQKERLEQERMNLSEGTPVKGDGMGGQQSPLKISDGSLGGGGAAELAELEEKYQKVMKDYETMRRENIGLQLEIEKGKKTLEAEKNVLPLSLSVSTPSLSCLSSLVPHPSISSLSSLHCPLSLCLFDLLLVFVSYVLQHLVRSQREKDL